MRLQITCGLVVFDELNYIKKLIPQVQSELTEFDIDWIIVLNHPNKNITNQINLWLKNNLKNVSYFVNLENNIGSARQKILETASTDYIYFIDPDICLTKSSIKPLLDFLYNDQTQYLIGCGGPSFFRSSNRYLQINFILLTKLASFIPFAFQVQNHSKIQTVDHLPTCHLLVKRELALKIGGFSKKFQICGEDLDFSHRAAIEGLKFVFIPQASVFHWQNLNFKSWFKKVFLYGRTQILVQAQHTKQKIRWYRLYPALLLIIFIIFIIKYISKLQLQTATVLFIFTLIVIFHWLILTFFAYSFGQISEIFLQLFELKSVKKHLLKDPRVYSVSNNSINSN